MVSVHSTGFHLRTPTLSYFYPASAISLHPNSLTTKTYRTSITRQYVKVTACQHTFTSILYLLEHLKLTKTLYILLIHTLQLTSKFYVLVIRLRSRGQKLYPGFYPRPILSIYLLESHRSRVNYQLQSQTTAKTLQSTLQHTIREVKKNRRFYQNDK